MNNRIEDQVSQLLASIKSKRSFIDTEAIRLRSPADHTFDKHDPHSWCLSATGDCLIRLRLFTEQNFDHIETMGLISVARYIFEMCVWLQLFRLDSGYGLVYYSRLIDTQHRYWKDVRAQIDREIALLRKFEKAENDAISAARDTIKNSLDPEQHQIAFEASKAVADDIDRQAARHFSIYADQAKVNGYGFQAYLVTNRIPEVEGSISQIITEQAQFDASVTQAVRDLIPDRWNWEKMAKKVGMSDEYDFIYRYSSKLLHATPASITTDQKNLELSEFSIFLKFIQVKIDDVLEIANLYPTRMP